MSPRLATTVLAHFDDQLHTANDLQFTHLAERAEAAPPSRMAFAMRVLVDAERLRRAEAVAA